MLSRLRRLFAADDAVADIDTASATAQAHLRTGHYAEAERLCRAILHREPGHAASLFMLGVLAHQAGKSLAALDLIAAAIARDDTIATYHNDHGSVLLALGRAPEAEAAFHAALARDSHCGAAWFNLGTLRRAKGDSDAAQACQRRALCLLPESADVHVALAMLSVEAGRFADALPGLTRAVTLRPGFAEAHLNLGNVLRELSRPRDGARQYALALAAQPTMVEALYNLARLQREENLLEEACSLLRRALILRPDTAQAYNNYAVVRHRMGRRDDAVRAAARCLTIKPDEPAAIWGQPFFFLPIVAHDAEEARAALLDFDRALTQWREAVLDPAQCRAAAGQIGSGQPFYLVYRPGNHRDRLSLYGDTLASLAAARWPSPTISVAAPPRRQIVLAIVSFHVHLHSVWEIILHGILAHLDRDRFTVTLIHTGSIVDAQTTIARTLVDHFHGSDVSFEAALALLRETRPDVVFYPEIGMDTVTCRLAALRLAPLQVTHWGHPITSGLPTIDLYFSGDLLEPADGQSHYRERLIRLPGTGAVTLPPSTADVSAPSPSREDEAHPLVNFVLCQNAFKFDPVDDDLYARILADAGPSRLWVLLNPTVQWNETLLERLSAALRRHGVDPETVMTTLPWMRRPAFAEFLATMDVYLDCPAFSGYTTARQATYAGLPIVTWEGPHLRQRLAAGLLRQIGRTDTIAGSADDFVAIALRLAAECRQPAAAAHRRTALRGAAVRADGNVAAVAAFQQTLVDELVRRGIRFC